MVWHEDFRWRAVSLIYVYTRDINYVSDLFGPSVRSIKRWLKMFESSGTVMDDTPARRTSRWPAEALDWVLAYVSDHPCFYFDELQSEIKTTFPTLPHVSISTILRVLQHGLKVSRKKLTNIAQEAVPREVANYECELGRFYQHPSQLLLLDETSKDGRDTPRKYAWFSVNTKTVVRQSFSRGNRVSVLATID